MIEKDGVIPNVLKKLLEKLKAALTDQNPELHEDHAKTRYAQMVNDAPDLPATRIEYALDKLQIYKWQDNYSEMADVLINDNCPGDILDWGEPVVDEKTAAFDTNGHIAGCRGITCKKCWNQEVKK